MRKGGGYGRESWSRHTCAEDDHIEFATADEMC